MLLVRNIRLPLTCPDPDAEAAAKALAILRVPARRAAHCGVAKLSVDLLIMQRFPVESKRRYKGRVHLIVRT